MKKRLLTIGLLLMCLVLAACNAKDPKNLFETTEGNTADTTAGTVSSLEITEPRGESEAHEFDDSVMFEEGYQYGNMQKNVPPGGFMQFGNEVLFTPEISRLYVYNLTTGEVSPFCRDATCRHTSCAASRLSGNLEVYNGKIYSKSDNSQIIEIRDGEEVIQNNSEVRDFFHHNDKLYARTHDSSLVVLNTDEDEPRVVIEEYTSYWNVIFGPYLYGNSSDNIVRFDITMEDPKEEVIVSNGSGITDGQHIYYVDNQTNYLYCCNMDGSDVQLLLDKPVLLASINFDNEYFYFRLYSTFPLYEGEESHDIYRLPKDNLFEVEKIATLPEAAYQIYTIPEAGKIFIRTITADGENPPFYVCDADGNNLTQLAIPEY